MLSMTRIGGLTLRYFYLYRGSLPRLLEQLYWPVVDLLVWGFVTIYLSRFEGTLPNFMAYFLGGLVLWDILFRSQVGVSVAYLEEIWSRNLLNLFVSPLRPIELLLASMGTAVMRVVFTASVSVTIAWLFYGFNLFVMGIWVAAFMGALMLMGWALGIFISALVMRFGQGAESLAWGLIFLVQPVAAVFYPVSVLPLPLQYVSAGIPASHVFEGMRQVLDGGPAPLSNLLWAYLLGVVYMGLALTFFYAILREARREGRLLRVGE
ncbi:MAG: ABC transporter permease [Nitrospirota bacterium]|nr:ABC transporter permease [Nitrospirota bacterium]